MAQRQTRIPWKSYGLEPVGGTSRRYRDVQTGETVSYREALNRRAVLSSGGAWHSYEHWRSVTGGGGPRRYRLEHRDWQYFAVRTGRSPRELRDPASPYSITFARWQALSPAERKRARHQSRGRFHDFLVAGGWREPNAPYPIGQTGHNRPRRQ